MVSNITISSFIYIFMLFQLVNTNIIVVIITFSFVSIFKFFQLFCSSVLNSNIKTIIIIFAISFIYIFRFF